MTRSRILAYGLAIVLGATVGPCLVIPAHAETIELLCAVTDRAPKDLYVSIDMSAGTAASWITSATRADVSAWPATITRDKVAWVSRWKENVNNFTLDRTTGVLLLRLGGGSQEYSWACKKKP